MDQRGKTMVDVFGPETLDEINAGIQQVAEALGLTVTIMQTNDEDIAVQTLKATECDAVIINPGGFTVNGKALTEALKALAVPAYEVHASNPSSRGIQSVIQPACKGAICGFGYAGYAMALRALSE